MVAVPEADHLALIASTEIKILMSATADERKQLLLNLWEHGYSRGLKHMDQMHKAADDLLKNV